MDLEDIEPISDEELKESYAENRHEELTNLLKKLTIAVSQPDRELHSLIVENTKTLTNLLNNVAKPVKLPELKAPDVKVTTNQEGVIKAITSMASELNSNITKLIDCMNKPMDKKEYEFTVVRDDNGMIDKVKIRQK
jgi:hypothetical protein